MGHGAQNEGSAMDPVPCNPINLKKIKYQHGAGNLDGLEGFWMKEWSLLSLFYPNSSGIVGLIAVKLAKGVC